ncbi:MAG: polysaccharide deacetylase family protein [Gemmatimonadales bacterium]
MKDAVIVVMVGLALWTAPAGARAQATLAERLGYDADAKLLIVHADDIGVARSVNIAVERAFESGSITSGSVMVPCPWFPDFAAYYTEHQPLDVGIHITLTAEWDYYKWGGVSAAGEIPSLLDEYGHFYPTAEAVAEHAVPVEVEREVRAQIERALALGIRPTHLDTHMGTMAATPELVEIYLRLGEEYGIPPMIPRSWVQENAAESLDAIAAKHVLLDGLYMMHAEDSTKSWSEAYGEMLAAMGPGLNQLIVHLGIDDAELQAVTVNHPDFGSAWRQRDFEFVTSEEFRRLLAAHDIRLVSWSQIREVL